MACRSLVWVIATVLVVAAPVLAEDDALLGLLRTQVFNKEFEGFEYYHVSIESDERHSDGSREVLAVASGKFLDNTKRMKVLVLLVGEQIIGGQVLEHKDLPPCLTPNEREQTSL